MSISDHLLLFTATGFGMGRSRWAPGTFGSLWGFPIAWGLSVGETEWWTRLLIGAVMFVIGIPICAAGCRLLKRKDPPSVVWDEMSAFPIVFAFTDLNWWTVIAGFVIFRFFDILKPWPIRRFEDLPGGLGVMADDAVAAFFAAAVLFGGWSVYLAQSSP